MHWFGCVHAPRYRPRANNQTVQRYLPIFACTASLYAKPLHSLVKIPLEQYFDARYHGQALDHDGGATDATAPKFRHLHPRQRTAGPPPPYPASLALPCTRAVLQVPSPPPHLAARQARLRPHLAAWSGPSPPPAHGRSALTTPCWVTRDARRTESHSARRHGDGPPPARMGRGRGRGLGGRRDTRASWPRA